jgi:hypothetical protein
MTRMTDVTGFPVHLSHDARTSRVREYTANAVIRVMRHAGCCAWWDRIGGLGAGRRAPVNRCSTIQKPARVVAQIIFVEGGCDGDGGWVGGLGAPRARAINHIVPQPQILFRWGRFHGRCDPRPPRNTLKYQRFASQRRSPMGNCFG